MLQNIISPKPGWNQRHTVARPGPPFSIHSSLKPLLPSYQLIIVISYRVIICPGKRFAGGIYTTTANVWISVAGQIRDSDRKWLPKNCLDFTFEVRWSLTPFCYTTNIVSFTFFIYPAMLTGNADRRCEILWTMVVPPWWFAPLFPFVN